MDIYETLELVHPMVKPSTRSSQAIQRLLLELGLVGSDAGGRQLIHIKAPTGQRRICVSE